MSDRKLVTLRTVDAVEKHPNADALDLVKIGGWQCVSKIGTFKPGDVAIYFEIDSFVPTEHPAFSFLEKNAIKWNGKVGARIKTIKLRGEISQGLLIPPGEFPELEGQQLRDFPTGESLDLAPLLGVEKWERAIPAALSGKVRGNFPSFLRKTDQERIQNLWGGFGRSDETRPHTYKNEETGEVIVVQRKPKYLRDKLYEVTVKLDGSSMTAYRWDQEFGVCSRNLDLAETEGNAFWQAARKYALRERMAVAGLDIAIQGELLGPAIQGNNEGLTELQFFVFDIFDIVGQRYLDADDRQSVIAFLNMAPIAVDAPKIQHVPVLDEREFDFETIEVALAYAEGRSLNPESKREGVVFKSLDNPDFSFKIIANSYLLEHSDR